jgi:hypothetical protein
MSWIYLPQHRVQIEVLVNTGLNLQVP